MIHQGLIGDQDLDLLGKEMAEEGPLVMEYWSGDYQVPILITNPTDT